MHTKNPYELISNSISYDLLDEWLELAKSQFCDVYILLMFAKVVESAIMAQNIFCLQTTPLKVTERHEHWYVAMGLESQ